VHNPLEPIVITGVGVLACNGTGRVPFWKAIEDGVSGIGPINRFDASDLPCQIAGQLPDFDANDYLKASDVRRWHRFVHQALASAQLAVDDSEFEGAGYPPERIAVAMGTSIGSLDENYEHALDVYNEHGWKKVDKLTSSASSGHSPTANVSARFGFRGPASTIGTGCTTGLEVISWGCDQIRRGLADAAVVGTTEAPLSKPTFTASCAMGILSKRNDEPHKAMRPFDTSGDGLVLSEAAATIILERAGAAKARGARILGEFAGYGAASEGGSTVLLERSGATLARAVQTALAAGGLEPTDIDCAHCHGVSLMMYDQCETKAYKQALGKHAYRIPITANKSMIGQAYSAGGMLSVVTALMTLNTGIVPPTINLEDPDPRCDLDFVPLRARRNDVNSVLVSTLSFGGTHGAAILRNLN